MGASATQVAVAGPRILSEMPVVHLLFLVFLLRIYFDNMRHFCEFCEALLRLGI